VAEGVKEGRGGVRGGQGRGDSGEGGDVGRAGGRKMLRKVGEGSSWRRKEREGSGEEEVNLTLPLARSAWTRGPVRSWLASPKSRLLASLCLKSSAFPSI